MHTYINTDLNTYRHRRSCIIILPHLFAWCCMFDSVLCVSCGGCLAHAVPVASCMCSGNRVDTRCTHIICRRAWITEVPLDDGLVFLHCRDSRPTTPQCHSEMTPRMCQNMHTRKQTCMKTWCTHAYTRPCIHECMQMHVCIHALMCACVCRPPHTTSANIIPTDTYTHPSTQPTNPTTRHTIHATLSHSPHPPMQYSTAPHRHPHGPRALQSPKRHIPHNTKQAAPYLLIDTRHQHVSDQGRSSCAANALRE